MIFSESTQIEETCSYDGILNPSPSPTRFNFTKNFPDELKNDFVRSFLGTLFIRRPSAILYLNISLKRFTFWIHLRDSLFYF